MPERITKLAEVTSALVNSVLFFLVGAAIALLQILGSSETTPWRVSIARALATGGLAIAAGSITLLIPAASLEEKMGIAAIIASLGVSGIERLFAKILDRRA